jgi:hypothetical protein
MTVLFNRRYLAEDPFLLTQIVAHELLHEDSDAGAA